MNRPQRVRQVYAELQRSVGDLATKSELLRAAADLVDVVDQRRLKGSKFSLRTGGQSFEQWPLDRAMADGGWRVLAHETDVVRSLFEDERDSISSQIELDHWMMEHAA